MTAGIDYETDAKQSCDAVRVVAQADASLHSPIVYPAVVMRDAKNRDATLAFVAFLKSEPARAMLRSRGFLDAQPAEKK